jgi:hypothetical protein
LPGSLTYRPWLPIFANPMIAYRQRYVGEFRRKERPILVRASWCQSFSAAAGQLRFQKGKCAGRVPIQLARTELEPQPSADIIWRIEFVGRGIKSGFDPEWLTPGEKRMRTVKLRQGTDPLLWATCSPSGRKCCHRARRAFLTWRANVHFGLVSCSSGSAHACRLSPAVNRSEASQPPATPWGRHL